MFFFMVMQVQPAALKTRPQAMLHHLTTPLSLQAQDESKEQYRERCVLSLLLRLILASISKVNASTITGRC